LFCSKDGKHVAVVELKANSSSTAESVRDQARKYASSFYDLNRVSGVRAYIVRTTTITANTLPQPELVCDLGAK
jgi:type I site-specific restriction endonuclease